MKKTLICAGALMFCTMGFAQVAPSTTSGPTPEARGLTKLAGAAVGANVGESIQNGDANKVQVRQAGTNQQVYTNQNNGLAGGIGNNLAKVIQVGAVSGASGQDNRAEVLQQGSENQSNTYQGGDLNNAITEQGLDTSTLSAGNKAEITQGVQNAENNFAAIRQDGLDNEAKAFQGFDNNDLYILQDGNDNQASVNQNSGSENTEGHQSLVEQYGDNNDAIVAQSTTAQGGAISHVIQDGDGNYANQDQNVMFGAAVGMGNQAIINQGSTAAFDNVGASLNNPLNNGENLYDAVGNIGENIEPNSQNSGSANGIAFQRQDAKMSEAEIHQFGVAGQASNYAEQYQEGWNQNALLVQNSYGTSNGGGNYGKQVQLVDNNDAALVQLGRDNKAYQFQTDRRNIALSTQRGNGNLLNTHQFGNENVAHTLQRGENNAALVVQRGGQSYTTQQNVQDGFVAGNNQIDALQLGPNGDFSTDGVNCMFMDEQIPGGVPEIPSFDLIDICPGC